MKNQCMRGVDREQTLMLSFWRGGRMNDQCVRVDTRARWKSERLVYARSSIALKSRLHVLARWKSERLVYASADGHDTIPRSRRRRLEWGPYRRGGRMKNQCMRGAVVEGQLFAHYPARWSNEEPVYASGLWPKRPEIVNPGAAVE